jgi:GNAT superfamily N-acetyltransferase
MASSIAFTPLSATDHESVARLLHRSLVEWYESRLRQGARFGDNPEPFRIFPEVYEALDPGEAVTARDTETGELLGICFSHERETHVAVGIVATSPEATGRGIARSMMQAVLDKARALGKPARLVSSLLNLDSFSLYNRLGFVPGTIFQDLLLSVPAEGIAATAPAGAECVRLARPDEAARLADFEHSLQGIRREKDYAFFLANRAGSWKVLVSEDDSGELNGVLVLSDHPCFTMIGPGVAADETSGAALLWRALDLLRGRTVVFLAPSVATGLVRTAYSWGARNVELHVSQSTVPVANVRGIVFPTFLPESG